jgi:type II secretory ATPase GspE/PulE/Tfp pilus assembly ATPase PilB-like protein
MARLIASASFQRPLELVLEERAVLDQQTIAHLKAASARNKQSFEECFIQHSGLPETLIYQTLAEHYGLEYTSLENFTEAPELPERLMAICHKEKVLAASIVGQELTIALSQPEKTRTLRPLLAALGFNAIFKLAAPSRLDSIIGQPHSEKPENDLYSGINSLASSLMDNENQTQREIDQTNDISVSFDTPSVVELVIKTLRLAVSQNASYIHA